MSSVRLAITCLADDVFDGQVRDGGECVRLKRETRRAGPNAYSTSTSCRKSHQCAHARGTLDVRNNLEEVVRCVCQFILLYR
jgi:hypothetical protein